MAPRKRHTAPRWAPREGSGARALRVAALAAAWGQAVLESSNGGRVVAVLAGNGAETLELLMALWEAGLCAALLSARWGASETQHALRTLGHANIVAVVAGSGLMSNVRMAVEAVGLGAPVMGLGEVPKGSGSGSNVASRALTTPRAVPFGGRAAVVCFTSGSTGSHKGAAISLAALGAQGLAKMTHCGVCATTRLLQSAPLYHVGGLSSAVACLMAGAAHVWPARGGFSALALVEAVEGDGVNALIAVPAMLEDVLAWTAAHPQRATSAAARVRSVLVGGGAPSVRATAATVALFGSARIVFTYGMTEAASSVTFIEAPIAMALHAGGRGLGAATWLGDERERAPPGGFLGACVGWAPPHVQVGFAEAAQTTADTATAARAVCTRGPHVMLGYWGAPRETRAALDPVSGWLTSGDAGWRDSSGALWLLGRLSDSIRTGAEWVMAAEVQAALESHPAVIEAAVVPVPDDRLGEAVGALVVVSPDKPPGVTADALRAHCAARGMARYKLPRRVVVQREALPRGAGMAKVLKGEVLRRITDAGKPRAKL